MYTDNLNVTINQFRATNEKYYQHNILYIDRQCNNLCNMINNSQDVRTEATWKIVIDDANNFQLK
jgi:hypothetical protein